jgi:putative acetyltransferase
MRVFGKCRIFDKYCLVMPEIIRTNSDNPHFRQLVVLLDGELTLRYGDLQKHYAQFNHIHFLDTVVVAFENDVAAGCGCFRSFAPGKIEIKRMYVRPEFRRRGISRLILAELERWAAGLGYSESVLETGNQQDEAIQLYHHFGYAEIPNYGNYEGTETSICMSKKLN